MKKIMYLKTTDLQQISGGYNLNCGLSGATGMIAGIGAAGAVALMSNPVGAAGVGLFALGSWTAGLTSSTLAFFK